jgi:hypothetical protein
MKEIMEKISSYNLFNYLLPGALFAVIAERISDYKIVQKDTVIGLLLYYFIGLVISRVGSLIVEPISKRVGFVVFSDYNDFVRASQDDAKIELFSEINNMYRTLCSLFVVLLVLKIYSVAESACGFIKDWGIYGVLILLLTMFLFAYRKQTEYIRKRVSADNRDA